MPFVKIKMTAITTILMLIISSILITSVNSSNNENNINTFSGNNEYTDISVGEAWAMLNDTSNGIQYPIDIRTYPEWILVHIDTPKPENPKHHNFYEWGYPEILNEFLTTYHGEEIIIYCRSGIRSVTASNILIDNNFDGTIYNMLGGINAWTSTGLPTISKRPPDDPNIFGSSIGKPGLDINFSITTNDPENDYVNFSIELGNGIVINWSGPYESGEIVEKGHSCASKDNYTIRAKARGIYGAESDWTELEISMPKTKATNTPFLTFLDNHPHLFPLLRQILGL